MAPLNRVKTLAYTALFSLLCFCTDGPSLAQQESFPTQSRYEDQQAGTPVVAPNSRQLTSPVSGQSTFNGFNKTLCDPTTGQSTFNGYSIKLTDPTTGAPTFKGYGQNPLMQYRQSAPDFKWNSNVDQAGKSQYTGFGRAPLTTSDAHSTFIGNNRKLTDETGAPSFTGNNRQLADPNAREDFLKQSQSIHVIPGRQSYINGRSFPGLQQPTPLAVPTGINQSMNSPTATGTAQTKQKETDPAYQPPAGGQGNNQAPPASRPENQSGNVTATESGSGF